MSRFRSGSTPKATDPDHGWWLLVAVTIGVFAVMLASAFLLVWLTR